MNITSNGPRLHQVRSAVIDRRFTSEQINALAIPNESRIQAPVYSGAMERLAF